MKVIKRTNVSVRPGPILAFLRSGDFIRSHLEQFPTCFCLEIIKPKPGKQPLVQNLLRRLGWAGAETCHLKEYLFQASCGFPWATLSSQHRMHGGNVSSVDLIILFPNHTGGAANETALH